jgi:hypothetical protein
LAIAIGLGGALAVPLAAAATDMPTGLVADTTIGNSTVHLSWEATSGASAYKVQISAAENFATIVSTQITYAQDWIPQTALSTDAGRKLFWRVFAYGTGVVETTLSAPAVSDFTLAPLTVPTSLSPGATSTTTSLTYPNAVVFSWNPVPGAVSYTVEYTSGTIGSNTDNLTKALTTTALSAAPSVPLARKASGSPIEWKWRVKANFYSGVNTPISGGPSAVRKFTIDWTEAPTNLEMVQPHSTTFEDLRFDWTGVEGATSYKLEVGTSKTADQAGIQSPFLTKTVSDTTYIPTTTLLNSGYFWQVTPLDVNNIAGQPSAIAQFTKSWPDYPEALTGSSDIDAPEVIPLDDFELDWEALPRATMYEVEVANVATGKTVTCRTANTSATIVVRSAAGGGDNSRLVGSSSCLWSSVDDTQLKVGPTYWWRVTGIDYSGAQVTPIQNATPAQSLYSISSDPRSSSASRPAYFTLSASTGGTALPISIDETSFDARIDASPGESSPLFTWDKVSSATGYILTVYADSGGTNKIAEVYTPSTTVRLTGVFADNTTDEPYYAGVKVFNPSNASWTDGTVVGSESPQFSWKRTTSPTELESSYITTKTDGTTILSWKPQWITGLGQGGSRGYFITIYKSGSSVGSAYLEYPFFVAKDPDTAATGLDTGKALSEGAYQFRVAPLDANGKPLKLTAVAGDFTIAVKKPITLTAAVGSSPDPVTGSSVSLVWHSLAPTTTYETRYRLATDTAWIDGADSGQPASSIGSLAPGTYAWQVRGIDSAGNPSDWSSGPAFTIPTAIPSTIGTSSPLPAASRVLSWEPVPGASRYIVQLADTQAMTTVKEYETIATSFSPWEARSAGTFYYWRVKAVPEVHTSLATRPVLGTSTAQAYSLLTSPGIPTIYSVVLAGRSLTASWTPLTGAAAGTTGPVHYVGQYRLSSTSADWSTATSFETLASAGSYSTDVLSYSTAYDFRVAAVNDQGQGPWSEKKTGTTAAPPKVAPTNLRAVSALGALAISWSAVTGASTGGVALTGYQVKYRAFGGGWNVTSAASTSITLTGLANATSYDVEVSAYNNLGEGPAAIIAATTLGLPAAPTGVSATAGDRATVISWIPPTDTGGSAITSYVVESRYYTSTNKSWSSWTSTSATSTPLSRTGLANGTTYEFRVTAKSKVGNGATSAAASVTPAGKPLAPLKPRLSTKKGKFIIKWSAAPNNGSAITKYVVQYSANGKKWTSLKTLSAKTKSYTTKKGKKGKLGYFRVLAKNALGSGPYTATLKLVRK